MAIPPKSANALAPLCCIMGGMQQGGWVSECAAACASWCLGWAGLGWAVIMQGSVGRGGHCWWSLAARQELSWVVASAQQPWPTLRAQANAAAAQPGRDSLLQLPAGPPSSPPS